MSNETSSKDYSTFDGPSDEQRKLASRRYRAVRGHGGDRCQQGGDLKSGTPRKGKFRSFQMEGIRVR